MSQGCVGKIRPFNQNTGQSHQRGLAGLGQSFPLLFSSVRGDGLWSVDFGGGCQYGKSVRQVSCLKLTLDHRRHCKRTEGRTSGTEIILSSVMSLASQCLTLLVVLVVRGETGGCVHPTHRRSLWPPSHGVVAIHHVGS